MMKIHSVTGKAVGDKETVDDRIDIRREMMLCLLLGSCINLLCVIKSSPVQSSRNLDIQESELAAALNRGNGRSCLILLMRGYIL